MLPSLPPIAVPRPGATNEPSAEPTIGRAVLATLRRTPPTALPTLDFMNELAPRATPRTSLPRNSSSSASLVISSSSWASSSSRLSCSSPDIS